MQPFLGILLVREVERTALPTSGSSCAPCPVPSRIVGAMGLYERHLCPCLTEWSLSGHWVREGRSALLADIGGRVLEIGFGTGLNLEYYPSAVTELDVLDPAEGMHARAKGRIAEAHVPVRVHAMGAERLPFDDETFDAVVSTFTLCTVSAPERAVREVRRVLKPGGFVHVFEHVASSSRRVRRWQDRLNPVQNVLGCGCNLNRDTAATLAGSGFDVRELERLEEPSVPRIFREHIRGRARRN